MHQLAYPKYRAASNWRRTSWARLRRKSLDKFKSSNERILWIDPHFKAGRLENYPEVPSNTKVCPYSPVSLKPATLSPAKNQQHKKLLKEFDPQAGCKLKWAAELL